MNAALHLAHQFDAAMHDWLRTKLPLGSKVDQLPADDPWAVADGTKALLVTNGKLRSLSRTAPPWATDLLWVHTRPTGVDEAPEWMFDVPHFTVSRGAASIAIAEYVLAAILDFEKRLRDVRTTSRAEWSGRDVGSLAGLSIGIVGLGEIGRAVAKLANAFSMTVRAVRRRAEPLPRVELVSFEDLCALSEHLVLCAPLTDETRSLLDERAFAMCRPGLHLINVARGALIVPDALRNALDGPVARATLDVWLEEPPPEGHWIYGHPRVLLTPHCSSTGPSTVARLQEILEMNLTAWLAGNPADMFGRVSRLARY
jgi:phosphoglycerate dehydrogenase-like enzyme